MSALEEAWHSSLRAEPSIGPGSMRHWDVMTKAPSNVRSTGAPRQTAYRPQALEQKCSLLPAAVTRSLSVCSLGPREGQQHVSLPWTRPIMPTLCCVEQERFSSSSRHRADTRAWGLGLTLNKEHGGGPWAKQKLHGPCAHMNLESMEPFYRTPCHLLKIDTSKTFPEG